MAFRSASVLILTRTPVLVMGITKDANAAVVSFPGGHIERDEDPSAAAARELQEETGIGIAPQDLDPLYATPFHITYIPRRLPPFPEMLQSRPFEGVVSFYTPHDFVRWARYPDYVKAVLQKAAVL